MKCEICGKELSSKNEICDKCCSRVNMNFVGADTKKSGYGFFYLLFIISTIIFFLVIISDNKQKQTFDISKGNSKYGDWYQDASFYRTDTLNLTSVLSREQDGKVEVSFIIPSSQCTEKESIGLNIVINVNRIPVKYFRHCYSRGFERYEPTSNQENKIVIDQFIKSNNVLVEDFWFSPNIVFSAKGFTKTFNFLSNIENNSQNN